MSYRILVVLAIVTVFACGSGGPPLDAGCPVCQQPDAATDVFGQ